MVMVSANQVAGDPGLGQLVAGVGLLRWGRMELAVVYVRCFFGVTLMSLSVLPSL